MDCDVATLGAAMLTESAFRHANLLQSKHVQHEQHGTQNDHSGDERKLRSVRRDFMAAGSLAWWAVRSMPPWPVALRMQGYPPARRFDSA